MDEQDFWAPRRCLREPIREIGYAAAVLHLAVDAHLSDHCDVAEALLAAADMPAVRAWTESLWGSARDNPDQWRHHRYREVAGLPPTVPEAERDPKRDLTPAEKREALRRWGFHCAFCGIPVIRKEVREAVAKAYPALSIWGRTNLTQHAAFQCMWVQYDHIVPHTRGGRTDLENVVITCAPCNYGRGDRFLEEVGLIDPRIEGPRGGDWDGLESMLGSKGWHRD